MNYCCLLPRSLWWEYEDMILVIDDILKTFWTLVAVAANLVIYLAVSSKLFSYQLEPLLELKELVSAHQSVWISTQTWIEF